MAKRKTRRASTRTKTVYKTVKRSKKSSGFSGLTPMVGAGLYGAARAKVATWITPLTKNIPGGSLADNFAMLGVAWAAKKYIGGKVPLVGQMASAGMLIEAAQIGQELSMNGLKSSGATSSGAYPV